MNDFSEQLKYKPKNLCKKCGKCCKLFKCNHLAENNLCKIHEKRPEECMNFPFSPWQEIPEGCGYTGWLFLQREAKKQEIRKQKEQLLLLEVALKTASEEQSKEIQAQIQKIKNVVDIYSKYGSWDW